MVIGEKIKNLRLQCGLTQEELADRCELTKGYISQLEDDLTSPSIATLKDILSAVGSSFTEFFSEEVEEKVVFAENDYIEKATDEFTLDWLVPSAQKNIMEPLRITLNAKCKTEEDFPHEGEEFGYVLKGEVIVVLGKKKFKVKKGQSFYYLTDKVHYILNDSDKDATFIWVSSPPNF
ncbi:MAG: cupin domain-containing protein [Clostridia bacterium]|nr:cupin domain-containing protein [Clostridia bacterium]